MLFRRFLCRALWSRCDSPFLISVNLCSSVVSLRVYSCRFAVRFLRSLRSSAFAKPAARQVCAAILDFIFCHLSFVMRFALAIGY